MKQLTFINSAGDSLIIKESYPYIHQNLDLDYAAVTIMANPQFNQDGENYYGSLLKPRSIAFDLHIKGSTEAEMLELCEEMYRIFNPRLGLGTLVYDNGFTKRQINAAVSYGPKEVELIEKQKRRQFGIGLYCPLPAWEDYTQTVLKLIGFIGGLQFATGILYWEYWNEWGMTADGSLGASFPISFAETGDRAEIEYEGNLDAPLLIEFRGPATMPKITKLETGEFIELNLELLEGEKLFINTKPSGINVYKDDGAGNIISAFNYLNYQSTYFQLTDGSNTIMFEAVTGNPEVYLYYRKQFIGA